MAKKFLAAEKFQLLSQIVRSTRSITANIAAGHGRDTYTDIRHFFIIERGSATETMEHLTTAFDEKCITNNELNLIDEKGQTIIKLINGYINFPDKSKATK